MAKKLKRHYRVWSSDDVKLLKTLARNSSIASIAKKLGRTADAVQQQAHRHNLSVKLGGKKKAARAKK